MWKFENPPVATHFFPQGSGDSLLLGKRSLAVALRQKRSRHGHVIVVIYHGKSWGTNNEQSGNEFPGDLNWGY